MVSVVIINNNGIYSGLESDLYKDITAEGDPTITSPPTALLPALNYEKMAEVVSKRGGMVEDQQSIYKEVSAALESNEFRLINVMINPMASRKAQQHEWLTRAKL